MEYNILSKLGGAVNGFGDYLCVDCADVTCSIHPKFNMPMIQFPTLVLSCCRQSLIEVQHEQSVSVVQCIIRVQKRSCSLLLLSSLSI